MAGLTREQLQTLLTCSIPVAAETLGLGRNSGYEAALRGDLPIIQIGRRKIVSVPRLREMIETAGRPRAA
jgi:hypothetical protein